MSRARIALVAALAALLPMLMAPSGGFPSRPTFQQVTVNNPALAVPLVLNGALAAAPNNATTATIGLSTAALTGTNGDMVLVPRTSSNGSFRVWTGNGGAAAERLSIDGTGASVLNGAALSGTILCTTACSLAAISVGQTARILKGTTTTRASIIVPALDPDLQFTNMPAGTYAVSARVMFTSVGGGWGAQFFSSAALSGTGGVENAGYYIAATAAGSCGAAGVLLTTSTTIQTAHGAAATYTCTSTGGGNMLFHANGLNFTPSATAQFGLDWAQQTSNVTGATVLLGSYLEVKRLN